MGCLLHFLPQFSPRNDAEGKKTKSLGLERKSALREGAGQRGGSGPVCRAVAGGPRRIGGTAWRLPEGKGFREPLCLRRCLLPLTMVEKRLSRSAGVSRATSETLKTTQTQLLAPKQTLRPSPALSPPHKLSITKPRDKRLWGESSIGAKDP